MKRYYITDRKAVGGFRPLLEVIREFEWVTIERALAMKLNQPTRILLEAIAKGLKPKVQSPK